MSSILPIPEEDAPGYDPNGVELGLFNGGYGRGGYVSVQRAQRCDVCKQIRACITIDGSEGEYAYGCICEECATRAFRLIEKELA